MTLVNWSFSALKAFENCPKRYNEVNRLKRVKDDSFAAGRGVDVHKMLENAVAFNQPIPDPYTHYQKYIDAFRAIPGDKYPEYQLTFTSDLQPRSWFAKDAWLRFAADLAIIDKPKATAFIVDYKTGKSKYADTEQLKLGACCVFTQHPEIHTVKGGLLFLGEEKFIQATYTRDQQTHYWTPFLRVYQQLLVCVAADTFVPKQSGLCKTCPVKTCEYNPG